MKYSVNSCINNKKILFLDDNVDLVRMVPNWFKNYSATVLGYSDHDEFLMDVEHIKTADAIIIDFYLGHGVTAIQIIKKIREINKDVLIITISCNFIDEEKGEYKTDDMISALNVGSNRVCVKEFNCIEIILASHFKVRDRLSAS